MLMSSEYYFNYKSYENKNRKSALAQAEIQIDLTKKEDTMDRVTYLPCNKPPTITHTPYNDLLRAKQCLNQCKEHDILHTRCTHLCHILRRVVYLIGPTQLVGVHMGWNVSQRRETRSCLYIWEFYFVAFFIQFNSRSENILQTRKHPNSIMKCFRETCLAAYW